MVVAVEKAVAVVMQESGRRALFDATQRLGANYREKVGLIKSESVGRCQWLMIVSDCGSKGKLLFVYSYCHLMICQL